MDSLESLDFSKFIIFSDDPWSLLVSFCQLSKLPLVVQYCDVICEWPLTDDRQDLTKLTVSYGFVHKHNNVRWRQLVLGPLGAIN